MTNVRRGGKHLVIYADGSISPKRGGAGAVVVEGHNAIVQVMNRILPKMTNNEAEYHGLMLGLELAAQLQAETVEFRLDSEIVVGQMSGRFAVNSPKLKVCHRDACVLARKLPRVTYRHIPRTQNALADALAGEASAGRAWGST